MENTLEMAPFPPLTWENHAWTGSIMLPAWAGFQSRSGAYGSEDSTEVSDGKATLNIGTPKMEQVAPSPEQAVALQKLVEQQDVLRDLILQAIFAEYPEWQTQYGYDEEDLEEFMPSIEEPNQLKKLMGLSSIHISNVAKDGVAYVGLEFGCTWDDEHGFGAMTHLNRVVQIGEASTAFLDWIADKDVESNS